VITVIGWTVILRDEISWFENRPLFGTRIAVTRATAQAATLSEKLRELGADVIEMPAFRVARLDLAPLREEVIPRLSEFEWLIFTSRNAVEIFFEQLFVTGYDARALAAMKITAVGPATAAALLERGISVDVIPERFVAEGLLQKLSEREDEDGSNVLYATAEDARDVLPNGLRAMGASVAVVPLYRSTYDGKGASRLRNALEAGEVQLVTFTSGSSVRGFVEAVGEELATRARAASIGPQTSEAARAAGIEVVVEAAESTIDGLVEAILRGE
jgi:uroporphyrinogen III methyltransferase/synthase